MDEKIVSVIVNGIVAIALAYIAYKQATLSKKADVQEKTREKEHEIVTTKLDNQDAKAVEVKQTLDSTHSLVNGQHEKLVATLAAANIKVAEIERELALLKDLKKK